MKNENILNKINANKFIQKLLNKIINSYEGFIAINGSKNTAKNFVIEEVANRLTENGYYHINFDFKEFLKSNDMLNDFVGNLLLEIKNIEGLMLVDNFLREKKIKKIISQKIHTNNRAIAFRYYFNYKPKQNSIDAFKIFLLDILNEFDKLIGTYSLKIIMTIENLFVLDLYEIYEGQILIELLAKNLKNIKVICSIDNDFLLKSELENIKNKKVFKTYYEITNEIETYNHQNNLINEFIKVNKVHDIELINSLNNELNLFESVMKKNYLFHMNKEVKINYFEEISFIFWILKYYNNEEYENFDLLIDYYKVWSDLVNNKKTLEITRYQNFNKLILNLRENDYIFKNQLREKELLDIFQKSFDAEIPVLFVFENNDKFNILNEYFLFFFFSANLIEIPNFYKEKKALCYKIDKSSLNPAVLWVFNRLRIREIKDIKNDKHYELFNKEIYFIFKTIVDLL
ncbi:ATP-binding protein [Spiroplasma gladiatoris]|uniref:ATP-binding protein n=1 Tax=Spiroplasma gladiatoris TaxID=2143 RepID=A0A4P7AHQ6_9MOLU|nr:hypothetical protein [Spiroplasma gladiatoris]QBQ07742.1 ATP-binding protein [Spiroplasma gladiatoris]